MNEHKSRFKAYLIPADKLSSEARDLANLWQAWRAHRHLFTDPEAVFLFIVIYLEARAPGLWWRRCRRHADDVWNFESQSFEVLSCEFDFLKKLNVKNPREFYQNYDIIKLPAAVLHCLAKWSQGEYRLSLRTQPISPLEMLYEQSLGQRIITLDIEAAEQGGLVDGSRDAFEFLLHDLIHADLFFGSEHLSQVDFFSRIQSVLLSQCPAGLYLQNALVIDREFKKDFEYLISDMNSHFAHMEAQLQSALVKHQLYCENKKPHEELSVKGRDRFEQIWGDLSSTLKTGTNNVSFSASSQALL